MTAMQRGSRAKLSDALDPAKQISVEIVVSGNAHYDVSCFALDGNGKCPDDRYMVFYNQPKSPLNEIVLAQDDGNGSAAYTVNLPALPERFEKIDFTVSIDASDGRGSMRGITRCAVTIAQDNNAAFGLEMTGNDFQTQKSIITIELYKKETWRVWAVANGFYGGLSDLLKHYGLEERPAEEKLPPPAPLQLTAPEGFVSIPPGSFLMGSPVTEAERSEDEGPRHQVTLRGFYLAKYPVTQREYAALMGTCPSLFAGDDLPVEGVSWFDAAAYCNKRSEKEGLEPAYQISAEAVVWNRTGGYRLPTEAEWEYACRAAAAPGSKAGGSVTTAQANYNGGAEGEYREKTTPVGIFAPNPWGLFDMIGNVWEWCWDWYGAYPGEAQTDPRGPASGEKRVLRGGSWYSFRKGVRQAARNLEAPSKRYSNVGFRLARS